MHHQKYSVPASTARVFGTTIALVGGLLAVAGGMPAATLCVNTGGSGGCYASIGAAVAAASAGDTIQVAHGVYKEYVDIRKSLYLIGANQENTIVDATGKPFGINVDGHEAPGLSGVTISGFTVKNANNAGIVVSNASNVTIYSNSVLDNDKGLGAGPCSTLTNFSFFFGEAADCGEGILLSGVDHSTLANNTVTGNAGGLLITDDTGATHDNLITGNSVVRNTAQDCGITLPSHSGDGVYHNTISGNDSSYNGGPGVGIFAPGPGSKAFGNVVINNHLRGNGLPGVTMHNHAAPPGRPAPIFNDNVIVGNDISANSQDFEDAATAGPTGINVYSVAPMSGTIISQNTIHEEAYDIVVKTPATSGVTALVHLNSFEPNEVGVQNLGTSTVDATQNWWGCSKGPGANGCATISGAGVLYIPWLKNPFQSND